MINSFSNIFIEEWENTWMLFGVICFLMALLKKKKNIFTDRLKA